MIWSDVGEAPTPARHAFSWTMLARVAAAALVLCIILTVSAYAQRSDDANNADPQPAAADAYLWPERLSRTVARQADTLDRLRKAVDRLQRDDQGLEEQRGEAEQLISDAVLTKQELQPYADTITQQIAKLGPVPKGEDASEAPELARERARLKSIEGQILAAQRRTDLTILRAQQLVQYIQDLRLTNFSRNLLRRSDSPVSAALWSNVATELPRVGTQIATIADNWFAAGRERLGLVLGLLLVSGAVFLILGTLRRRLMTRVLVEPTEPRPGFFKRVATASWLAPLIASPGSATVVVLFLGGELIGLWDGPIRAFAQTVVVACLIYFATSALATAILLPRRPSWSLIGTPSTVSRRLLFALNLIVGVYAIDFLLHSAIRLFQMPISIGVVETSLANLAFSAMLLLFAWTPMPDDIDRASGRVVKTAIYWLRIPLLLFAAAIVSATLLGYVALGRFLAGQVMLMGCGGAAVLLVHLAIRAMTTGPAEFSEPVEQLLDQKAGLDERRRGQIAKVIAFVLNAFLALAALVLLLLSWGIPQSQLVDGLEALIFGFEIGQVRISLFRILVGVGLFVAVLFVTRIVQRWLSHSVLSAKRMDAGIANSLHTVVGYVGMGIAALIGISYAGFDLTHFTVVVGALSLGVGLGLQSIVNNFVSGLILLVERPVKVGDWIVVGDQQGYVRKISVRATEIETFDRAAVIVPNAEFISSAVQNWTHRNAMGRVVVAVGVSYNADPESVRDILLDIAKNTDGVLGYPEPFVAFEDFGASSLDFSLRCYIADVNGSLRAKTALRMAIFRRFQDEGIEIPFPQQDVHLRDLDMVRAILTRMSEDKGKPGELPQMPEQPTAPTPRRGDDGPDAS
ncbi:MAG: DUF3772 domain-containing protein, partial [Hyphomicrobiaceae bacterium]